MNPFPKKDGGISVMPLCASAGIMEGDRQEFVSSVTEGTNLEFLSQSFDKVHKMKEGKAVRHVKAQVEKNAVFYYYPAPVIPYAQSAFESTMEFDLADKSSGLNFCWRSFPAEEKHPMNGFSIGNLPPG